MTARKACPASSGFLAVRGDGEKRTGHRHRVPGEGLCIGLCAFCAARLFVPDVDVFRDGCSRVNLIGCPGCVEKAYERLDRRSADDRGWLQQHEASFGEAGTARVRSFSRSA